MPKRSREEKILRYKEKLKKLEENSSRAKRRRRSNIIESDSDNSDEGNYQKTTVEQSHPTETEHEIMTTLADPISSESLNEQPEVPELAPEVLEALGDSMDDVPKYGEEIHQNLAQRWLPILRKGLQKETKDKLLSEYLPPSNCKLLKAPSLNPEIAAAITDALRNRDKKLQKHQDQLGAGISAINKVISSLLTKDQNEVNNIKILSDATRILTDLHYIKTQNRIQLLTPSLDKTFLNIIENEERDETLFGSNLNEKIKSARTIEKQGLSIKKNISTKPSSSTPAFRSRPGNWIGPPRFPANRGGRIGHPRMAGSATTWRAQAPPPLPPPPPAPQTRKPSYQNRQRAPLRR